MTNSQSSGFHVVETNGNGAQTIIYWLLGIFVLLVILAGIGVWRKHRQDPATRLRKKEDRRTQELRRVGRGCHGRSHSPQGSPPPDLGHHHVLQAPAPRLRGSKLDEALSALRLEQVQERRSLLVALGEREQFHSERLTRIESHQETQLGTMSSQLTSLSRQLCQTTSER